MENVAFRVDGGPDIGMGHVMRCLALADEFSKDYNIFFITKLEKSVIDKLKTTSYYWVPINVDINYSEEIKSVKKILKENKINIFIGDTYHSHISHDIDENYLLEIKKIVDKTVLISPKVSLKVLSDFVINGNTFAKELKYDTSNDDTKFLLGPEYALLRKDFQNLPDKDTNEKVKNIIITMGGSDPLNSTPKALKAIDKINNEDIHVDVVIGPAVYDQTNILKVIDRIEVEISLLFNPTNISKLMQKADLAISAGGGTLYELAATGTPAIVLLQAENQIPVAHSMEKEGTITVLGFGNQVEQEKLVESIKELMNDSERRAKMSRRGKKLIDGLGAKRCVDAILNK